MLAEAGAGVRELHAREVAEGQGRLEGAAQGVQDHHLQVRPPPAL